MKKKLIAIALVVIILAGVLSGCTLFVTNEERDYKQVLATVESDGVTGSITKGEFLEYYAQTAPMYVQYYGWTAEQCTEEFLAVLAKREIMLIKAKSYYAAKDTSLTVNDDIMKFLNESETGWVTRRANKMFQDTYDKDLAQKVADEKANQGIEDDTTEDEDALAPRPIKPEVDDEAEYRDTMPTASVEDFFTMMDKKNLTGLERKALDSVKKVIKDQYKDYNYFLYQQAESRLLTKFQDAVKNGEVEGVDKITISTAEITEKYNLSVNRQMNQYASESAYKTALDGTDLVLVHNNQYVKVKSILMQFTEAQKAILASLKETYKGVANSDEIVNQFRKQLVMGGDVTDFPIIIDEKNLGLLVNISNLDYKEDSVCDVKNCPCVECDNYVCPDTEAHKKGECKHDCKLDMETTDIVEGCPCVACENNAYEKLNVPYEDVVKMISDAVSEAAAGAEAKYNEKYPNVSAAEKQLALPLFIANEKVRVFDEWIYKVNDDPGMFEGKEYTATPSGKASDYVTEYTALIRAMVDNGATKGMMSTTSDKYVIGDKTIEIVTVNNPGSLPISYIINDFGVHIVMISTVPVDTVVNAGKYTETELKSDYINDNGDTVYDKQFVLKEDAIINLDEKTGKVITVKDSLSKTTVDSLETERYSVYERAIFKGFGDEFFFDKANLNKDINGIKIKLTSKVYSQVRKATGANIKE